MFMEKKKIYEKTLTVNKCLKSIDLRYIFKNFLCKMKKEINFFNNFLYFP